MEREYLNSMLEMVRDNPRNVPKPEGKEVVKWYHETSPTQLELLGVMSIMMADVKAVAK